MSAAAANVSTMVLVQEHSYTLKVILFIIVELGTTAV